MSMINVENLTFSYLPATTIFFKTSAFRSTPIGSWVLSAETAEEKRPFFISCWGSMSTAEPLLRPWSSTIFPTLWKARTASRKKFRWKTLPLMEEWELMRELSYLDVEADVLWCPFKTLSNGEQAKALLAALFFYEGHFLLIDEPTTHLDTKARALVSAYLKKKKGFILVSHGRCFPDDCVDHILSPNRANIKVQSGNFSSWMENFQRQQEFEQAHLYVWDEPLNFIDIYSRIQIEQLLRSVSPTTIFVEHDQAFQKAIATKAIHL